ncbi:hypothetical protein ACYSUW_03055 [Pseudomonas frederiksbergensis]
MSNVDIYDKTTYLANAKRFVELGDDNALRHACLELRYLIEAHVYKRLLQDADTLPATIINTWQPYKAIKLLHQFDSLADQNLIVELSNEDSVEKTTINYNNLTIKEITRHYNDLGGFLHLPQPKKSDEYKLNKQKIMNIYQKLASITEGNLIIYKIIYDSFECERCSLPVVFTTHYAMNNEYIDCQNDQCAEKHIIKIDGDKIWFSAHYELNCTCGQPIRVLRSEIKDGHLFDCAKCNNKYSFELIIKSPPSDRSTV